MRLRTGPAPPAAVPDAANSSSEPGVIDGHHIQRTPIATGAPGWRIGIPANPTRIGAMRTSCAHVRQLTLPMLSSSPNVPIGDRPLIAQIASFWQAWVRCPSTVRAVTNRFWPISRSQQPRAQPGPRGSAGAPEGYS